MKRDYFQMKFRAVSFPLDGGLAEPSQ